MQNQQMTQLDLLFTLEPCFSQMFKIGIFTFTMLINVKLDTVGLIEFKGYKFHLSSSFQMAQLKKVKGSIPVRGSFLLNIFCSNTNRASIPF